VRGKRDNQSVWGKASHVDEKNRLREGGEGDQFLGKKSDEVLYWEWLLGVYKPAKKAPNRWHASFKGEKHLGGRLISHHLRKRIKQTLYGKRYFKLFGGESQPPMKICREELVEQAGGGGGNVL